MRKLKRCSGESLVEALVALLILTLLMTMLPIAMTTSARLNRSAQDIPTLCTMGYGADGTGDKEACKNDDIVVSFIPVSGESATETVITTVKGYVSEGFYFYESN